MSRKLLYFSTVRGIAAFLTFFFFFLLSHTYLNVLCYKVQLKFSKENEKDFEDLIVLLQTQKSIVNFIFDSWFLNKIKLNLVDFHKEYYNLCKSNFPNVPVQLVIKSYKEALAYLKSIKSNKYILTKAPKKKNLSFQLDQRLYSKFSINGILITSLNFGKRIKLELNLYPKIEELFDKYKTAEPKLFLKDNKIYLSVPFKINLENQEEKQANGVLGIDLGIRRLFTTSDGNCLKGNEFSRFKRKFRHNRKQLQKLKTKSSKRRDFEPNWQAVVNKPKSFWASPQPLKVVG